MTAKDTELELRLLSSHPIYVGAVPVYPITFHEIASPSVGYDAYNWFINFFCISEATIAETVGEGKVQSKFIFMYTMCTCYPSLLEQFNRVAKVVFGCTGELGTTRPALVFDGFEISNENYTDVAAIVKKRNYIRDDVSDDDGNPADETARALLEKRRQYRKRLSKAKQSENDTGVTIADMVSVFSAVSGRPLWDVMRYDSYQLIHQLRRHQVHEEWSTAVQALLHGADPKKMDLKPYLRRLDDVDTQ